MTFQKGNSLCVGRKHSEETKRKISEGNRRRYQNPEERKKSSEALKLANQNPETREKHSLANKKRWEDKGFKTTVSKKISESQTAFHKNNHKTRMCAYCGKYFTGKHQNKYCSRKCYGDSKKKPNIRVECAKCGKVFYKLPAQFKLYPVHYCSKSCAASVANWKGGIAFLPYCPKFNEKTKEEVREAFGRKCYLCDTPENGKHLHVHHCDYNKSQGCTGQRWSLIPLCNSCHAKTNGKRYHWFNLLRDYWLNDYIDFVSGFPLF